ncbi:MAG: hypothetical protein ABSH41_07565 [Syntrophobacteraceae bacterium]
MARKIRFLTLVFIAVFMFACHRGGTGDIQVAGDIYSPKEVMTSPYKVRVTDVSNDTHEVYDVDVIGLLWNGLEDSLKKRGMLWTPQLEGEPYVMEGHVVYFKKGGGDTRWLPYVGNTVLTVRVELSQGGRHLASIESKHKIAYGSGTFTRNAWKKIFEQVSEDVVNQAVKNF